MPKTLTGSAVAAISRLGITGKRLIAGSLDFVLNQLMDENDPSAVLKEELPSGEEFGQIFSEIPLSGRAAGLSQELSADEIKYRRKVRMIKDVEAMIHARRHKRQFVKDFSWVIQENYDEALRRRWHDEFGGSFNRP